jgi:hypothetical protein
MAKHPNRVAMDKQIATVLAETGEADPNTAIRVKARELIGLYHATFGGSPPFSMEALESLRGIRPSEESPAYSPDAELHPDGKGGVLLRVNRERPRTRQNFSVGHEITHTFFPGYGKKVQCRKPAGQGWADPEDVLEKLCDVGASELLFPLPWFENDAAQLGQSTLGILKLAEKYEASLEATVRRLVDTSTEAVAAVFFRWKLKPTQTRKGIGRKDQPDLFGLNPEEEARTMLRLRVEYSLASSAFAFHIPRDKSVESEGAIYDAAASNRCVDAEESLDLGPCRGDFCISAMPLFTEEDALGPKGEKAVVAVIRPQKYKERRLKKVSQREC